MRKKRSPRSSRAKAIRNILLIVLTTLYLWPGLGTPAFTEEMALHRNERRSLIDRSEIVFTCESEEEGRMGSPLMLIGVSPYTIQTSSRSHRFNVWPRNPDGPTLVVLPSEIQASPTMIAALAAADPPIAAVRAELTLDLTAEPQGRIYTLEGERRESIYLFLIEEPSESSAPLDALFHTAQLPPYTLRFYSAGGTQIAEVTNIVK